MLQSGVEGDNPKKTNKQTKSLITKRVQNYVDIHCASPTLDQVHPNDTGDPAWVELVQEVGGRPTGSLWRVQVNLVRSYELAVIN